MADIVSIQREVEERMGFCPGLFLVARSSPASLGTLWNQAQLAYLDNPLPSLFKERLFVYLSRYCRVPYCLARHTAFLLGSGTVSGDPDCEPLSLENVLNLLQEPITESTLIQDQLALLSKYSAPLQSWPRPDDELEKALRVCCVPLFSHQTEGSSSCTVLREQCQRVLQHLLGPQQFDALILLLAFIQTAHLWTESHIDLALEDDVQQLMTEQPELANCITSMANRLEEALDEQGGGIFRKNEIQLRRAEDALRRSEAQFRAILETAADGIITINQSGMIQSMNQAAEKLFGYSSSEVIGKNVNLLMPEPYRSEHDGYLSNYLRSGERKIIGIGREVEGCRKTGERFPMDLAVSEVELEGGERLFTGVVRDLTERKEAEARETTLGRILEESLNEIYIFDAETLLFIQVNHGACANLGFTLEELQNLTPLDLKPEMTPELFSELLEPLRTGSESIVNFETWHRRKDGSRYDVEVRLQLSSYKGTSVFVAIILDVTERRKAREELKMLNEELESRVQERTRELNEAQEQLIRQERLAVLGQLAGGVAHEVRNPLAIIRNAAYYLRMVNAQQDEETREAFDEVERALSRSNHIISELLDYAREPQRTESLFSIDEMISYSLRDAGIPATIQTVRSIDSSLRARGDREQMERVMLNLILNAVQAMPDGGRLTLTAERQNDVAVISVEDTGAGIAPEDLPKVFDPLFTRKTKGIGLGLAISQRYVDLNRGQLEVESLPGQGATFRLSLPLYHEREEGK